MQSGGADLSLAHGSVSGTVIRPGTRPTRALAALGLAVLLAHLLLLRGVERLGEPSSPSVPAAVQVRSILPPPVSRPPVPQPPVPQPPATATESAKAAAAAQVPRAPRMPAGPGAAPPAAVRSSSTADEAALPAVPAEAEAAAEAAVAVGPQASSPASPADAAPDPLVTSSTARVVGAEPARGAEWPVYATRMPPSVTLRYQLSRGALTGSGDLRWQLEGSRYRLQLEGAVLGVSVLTQISEGAIDAAGIAPLRFTDQRARRSPQAANFQREAGKISFSGPSLELPLVPGVQDRLSWMIQLAAVVDADPLRWLDPGQPITLQVVGARGDAAAWVFRCMGPASLQLPEGSVQTLHFRREPRGPYDTTVDVWLDPQRHHLPVRALQRSTGEGDAFELRLREAVSGP